MDTEKLELALDQAKVGLMTDKGSVFVTTILFSLDVKFHPGIPTAGTNGIDMLINPSWFMGLTAPQRIGLLVHEVWHVALNHMIRGKDYDKHRYNIAGDHVINIMITDAGMQIPPDGCCDYQYRDMSTEQVYDKLPDNPPQDSSAEDIIYTDLPEDSPEMQELEAKITSILVKAKTQSEIAGEDPGSLPAEFDRHIETLLHPLLPWEQLLAHYMSNFAKDDYSYKRANRRYLPDFIMPSPHSERLADIGVAIDLSGSITDKELQAFLSELSYIQDTMKPERMVIIGFDEVLHEIHEIVEGDSIIDLKFTGGGGTNITPVIDYFNKRKPTATIIFTDCWFDAPERPPDFSHLWVIIDNPGHTPSTGEHAYYNF